MLLALILSGTVPACANMALFVGEPYALFGEMNPTGHAAIYLSRVCSTSPTLLRRCFAGENGVVISRYGRIAGNDWIAIPLIPYLYAVDRLEDVPVSADRDTVARLRDDYRHDHLQELVPDGSQGKPPGGAWVQLVGVSYDRSIQAFVVETTLEQDNRLIEELNSRVNERHFNLFFNNCADFAKKIINSYYPKTVHRSFVADAGMTTPKQVAKSLVSYSRRNPGLRLSTLTIRQISGSRGPSRAARGIFESLLRSKKYFVPLVVLQPWVTGVMTAAYLIGGRFDTGHRAANKYNAEALPNSDVAVLLASREPWPADTSGRVLPNAEAGDEAPSAYLVAQATLNMPAKVAKMAGEDSQYAIADRDRDGNVLDGTTPANVPAKDFWSVYFLRPANAHRTPDFPALFQQEQQAGRFGLELRYFGGPLLRFDGSGRAPDCSEQSPVYLSEPLRPARTLVGQYVAAE
jgi:hypothetical protein